MMKHILMVQAAVFVAVALVTPCFAADDNSGICPPPERDNSEPVLTPGLGHISSNFGPGNHHPLCLPNVDRSHEPVQVNCSVVVGGKKGIETSICALNQKCAGIVVFSNVTRTVIDGQHERLCVNAQDVSNHNIIAQIAQTR